jgi:steroid delta-isomerase-like uncharacterized protein
MIFYKFPDLQTLNFAVWNIKVILMKYHTRTGIFLFAILLTSLVAFTSMKTSYKTEEMKEYVLLIRLPLDYGPEQALAVRAQWTTLTDQWKADGIFVTSFIFPSESYVVSANNKVVNEEVISDDLRVISNIVIRASSFEEALSLAKKCPILEQGGTVEVREVQPRVEIKTLTAEELKNKEIIRNLYENILNNRKYELLDSVISPDYSGIGNVEEKGVKSFLHTVQAVITAFPDIKWNILDMMADGDKVILRWTWTATNTQPFRGIPASNKTVTDNAIVIYQIKEGKVINAWIQGDRLGVLMQMGLIPQDLIPSPQPKRD